MVVGHSRSWTPRLNKNMRQSCRSTTVQYDGRYSPGRRVGQDQHVYGPLLQRESEQKRAAVDAGSPIRASNGRKRQQQQESSRIARARAPDMPAGTGTRTEGSSRHSVPVTSFSGLEATSSS